MVLTGANLASSAAIAGCIVVSSTARTSDAVFRRAKTLFTFQSTFADACISARLGKCLKESCVGSRPALRCFRRMSNGRRLCQGLRARTVLSSLKRVHSNRNRQNQPTVDAAIRVRAHVDVVGIAKPEKLTTMAPKDHAIA